MRTLILFTALAAAFTLAASATAAGTAGRSTVTVHGSSYGSILFDGRGFVLYAFTRDGKGKSNCSGACAKAWPPYIVSGRPRTSPAITAALLGTTRRADGRLQGTYAGRPLYYYVGDRQPRQILCQNVTEFGGAWLVVRADGTLVR
jgi:predicted lipoprotein with Yx(FWY)xxD motif